MATSPRSSGDAARCNICGTTFSRQEHLSRHRKSHTREKPFRCPVCGKSFARQDVMSRHATTHNIGAKEGAPPVRLRACRQCAVCRVRCSRTEPCGRCLARSLMCVYPPDPTTRAPLSPAVGPRVEHLVAPANPHGSIQRPRHDSDNGTQPHKPPPDPAVATTNAAGSHNDIGPSGLHSSHLHGDARTLQTIPWNGQPAPLGLPEQQSYHRELAPENGVNEQIADLLAMNWISPDYSHQLDWTDMLAAGSLTRLEANGTLFPFLFDAPVPGPSVDGRLTSADSQTQSPSIYTAQVDLTTPPHLCRRGSGSGGNANEPAPRVSNAPSSYVEGGDARAAFAGRLTKQRQDASGLPQPCQGPLTIQEENVPQTLAGFTLVTPAAYNNMVHNIRTKVQQFNSLEAARFPSYQRITALVRLFFEKFHPIFPFIRRTGFSQESLKQWMLLLAVAVIGARYADGVTKSSSDDVLVQSLDIIANSRLQGAQEYLSDRSTWNATLGEPESSHLDLPTLQAITLDIIWKLHSGNKSLVKRALAGRYCLVTECNRMRLLSAVACETSPDLPPEAKVSTWLVKQSKLRTGMMIWLLDFMAAYQFNAPPLMQLVDAKGYLPCPDHTWEAPLLDKIQSDGKYSEVYLLDAVEMLYIEKRLPQHLTEFGTVLLIYGILRRTRESIAQTQTQLSSWIPTATVQQRTGQCNRETETWPPATPLLSRWRNSACDCLDILHWRANAKAAGSAGWEHSTILHLHVSRLVLLTPTSPLHTLAVLAGDATCMSNPRYLEARAVVLRWAIHDCFKARLSVIHAGAVFWHVRRYSSGMFLEPFAVYMSTLVLWAYSISTRSTKRGGQWHGQRSAETTATASISGNIACATDGSSPPIVEAMPPSATEEDEMVEPYFIHLDRPCDDEMVQTYIRKGTQISAYMARVGNITDDCAASKILQEGLRLLSAVASLRPMAAFAEQAASRSREGLNATIASGQWGSEQSYAGVLESLTRAMEGSVHRD